MCSVEEYVKEEVRDFANQGYVIRLVSENVTVGDWSGTGYIVTDLRTGASSCMLSDGTAGGRTVTFEELYEMNMMLFKLNLAVSVVALAPIVGGPDKLAEFAQFTKKNIEDSLTYMQNVLKGALLDTFANSMTVLSKFFRSKLSVSFLLFISIILSLICEPKISIRFLKSFKH